MHSKSIILNIIQLLAERFRNHGNVSIRVRDLTWSFSAYSQNIGSQESFILPFFTGKVSTVTFSEGGYTLSPLQNDKTTNILVTCFCHFDILAKTRSRVTTATTFSRQNDARSRACTSWYWENLEVVVVLVLESKALWWEGMIQKTSCAACSGQLSHVKANITTSCHARLLLDNEGTQCTTCRSLFEDKRAAKRNYRACIF